MHCAALWKARKFLNSIKSLLYQWNHHPTDCLCHYKACTYLLCLHFDQVSCTHTIVIHSPLQISNQLDLAVASNSLPTTARRNSTFLLINFQSMSEWNVDLYDFEILFCAYKFTSLSFTLSSSDAWFMTKREWIGNCVWCTKHGARNTTQVILPLIHHFVDNNHCFL